MKKKNLISERDILSHVKQGETTIALASNVIITPLARDCAKQHGIRFIHTTSCIEESTRQPSCVSIAIGSDHRGFGLKSWLIEKLLPNGYECIDVGTDSVTNVDYPVFAQAVGSLLQQGKASFGIMVDGGGIGSAIVLNKIRSVRCAHGTDVLVAKYGREHNDINALSLGSGIIGENAAWEIVRTFLSTSFEGGRHIARLGMIAEIENRDL